MARSRGSGKQPKLGIMGGTFDPIHNGHLQVVAYARDKAGLDRVLFIPAGQRWMKADGHITPAEHRVKMTRLAIEDEPLYALSSIEVDRPGLLTPSILYDNLPKKQITNQTCT